MADPGPAAVSAKAPPPTSVGGYLADLDPSTRRLLAEMMVGEAGGEGPRGMQAVMQVAFNRARMSGQTLEEVLNTEGAFTSLGPLGSRGRLDSEPEAGLASAYNVMAHPDPSFNLPPNITHFLNPKLQADLSAKDPTDYHGQPNWAAGQGIRIGNHVFYPGRYKGGQQMADAGSVTGNPRIDAALAASMPSPKLERTMQRAAETNLEAEAANTPAEIKAIEEKGALADKAAERLDGFIQQNEAIQSRMAEANEKLIASLPDEYKLRQQELAKVSNEPMDPTRVLGQFLPMLAVLGGAFTKAGVVGSLKAAASAMQAAKGNDTEALKRAHDEFQDQLTEVMDKSSLIHQELSDALAASKGNMNDYLQEVQLIGAKYDIPALKQAVYRGNAQDALAVSDGLLKTLTMLGTFNKEQLTLQQAALNIKAKEQAIAAGSLTPQANDYLTTIGRFGNIPGAPRVPSNLGLGAGPMRHEIIENMAKKSMAQWGTDDPQVAATADIGAALGMHADAQGLVALGKNRAQLTQFVDGADKVADLLEKQIGKGAGPAGGVLWNKFIQAARANLWTDPDVIKLRNVLLDLQQESGKIMQGSTGSVRAISDQMSREMQQMLSGNMPPEDIEGAVDVMRKGWAARVDGINEAFEETKGRITSAAGKKAVAGGDDAESAAPAPTEETDPLGIL